MPDLALRADRPYSLVTTVVRRGAGHCKVAQIDLHLTSGDVRVRFLDRPSLAHFCNAMAELACEAYLSDVGDAPTVWTRVYTAQDKTAGNKAEQLLMDGLFGPRY